MSRRELHNWGTYTLLRRQSDAYIIIAFGAIRVTTRTTAEKRRAENFGERIKAVVLVSTPSLPPSPLPRDTLNSNHMQIRPRAFDYGLLVWRRTLRSLVEDRTTCVSIPYFAFNCALCVQASRRQDELRDHRARISVLLLVNTATRCARALQSIFICRERKRAGNASRLDR